MLKKIALFSALAAIMGTTYAYKAEVVGTINYSDFDEFSDTGFTYQIDGKYFFNTVETKNNPLNEAAFLNRASNINAKYSYSQYEDNDNEKFRLNYYNAGLEYYLPNSNFYASAGIGFMTERGDWGNYDNTTYSAELGYLPVSGLLVAVGLAGYDYNYGYDGIDPTLRAKYVTQIGKFDTNLEANVRFGEYDEYYSVGTDLYLDKTLSIGVAYQEGHPTYDYGDYDYFTIRAKKFVNQNLSLEAKADFGDDYNEYGLHLGYRF